MFTVTKAIPFSAAHRILDVRKCSEVHGHNYVVEVTLAGDLDNNGMVLNFDSFRPLEEWINKTLDHALLLDEKDNKEMHDVRRKYFLPGPPTAEIMAKVIFRKAIELLPISDKVWVRKVEVLETERSRGGYEV